MRVAIISKTFVAVPAQRQLEWLAAQAAIDLTLITPNRWRTDDGGLMAFTPVHTAGYQVMPLTLRANGCYHRYQYVGLGRALAAIKPDLIHVDEEPYNPATWQSLWLAQREHVPAIGVSWQNLLRRYPPPYGWMERWSYRHLAAIIAGNADAMEVLRQKGYGGRIDTFSLHGIDPSLWLPRAATPPEAGEPFVIGYAGRLVPEKGIDVLLIALRRLPSRYRVRIIGRGPAVGSLRELASTLGVADRIEWWDHVESAAMPAAIRALDTLVLPSRSRPHWHEQFGRVLVEAMACGVPVVGADSGEIPRVIGEAGIVVMEGDAVALAGAVTQLSTNTGAWISHSLAGRQRVLAHFTQQRIAERIVTVYTSVLQGQEVSNDHNTGENVIQ